MNEINNHYILWSKENEGGDRIYNAAVWVCERLREKHIIPAEREKTYVYGFELLISSIVGILCLIFLSVLCGIPFAWLPYLIGFIPLRVTGGGYHARTHFMCILSFSAVFLILLYTGKAMMRMQNINLLLTIVSFTAMYFFAPVEAKNKPLSGRLRQRNRKRCLAISLCAVSFSAALALMKVSCTIHVMLYFMGILAADISILVVVIMEKMSAYHVIIRPKS